VVAELGAKLEEELDDLERRRLTDIANARLVADAKDGDRRATDGEANRVESALRLGDAVIRHLVVDLPSKLNELSGDIKLPGPPGEIERVYRQAVATHARARLEGHEPIRLGGSSVNDLPDVDAHPIGEQRQLIDKRNIDGAEDVLKQLGELRRLRAGDEDELIADETVELNGALRTRVSEAANDLGRVAEREVSAPRVDTLRAESEVEVDASEETRSGKCRRKALPRRPRIGGGLKDDKLARAKDRRKVVSGGEQRAKIRLTVVGERGWHADEDGVDIREEGEVSGGVNSVSNALKAVGVNILDIGAAFAKKRNPRRINVNANDSAPLLSERDGKRQPNVAKPNDPNGSHSGGSLRRRRRRAEERGCEQTRW
jgi:hypothetical protein